MWKNTAELDKPQTTTWHMPIAGWIPKATNTHSEYLILAAFPEQQLLHARSPMLRYTYMACLVMKNVFKKC
jgi:hypothetical protein